MNNSEVVKYYLRFLKEVGLMFGLLPSIGPWELILILGVALIVIGPGKLPEVGRALGQTLVEFKKANAENPEQASVKEQK